MLWYTPSPLFITNHAERLFAQGSVAATQNILVELLYFSEIAYLKSKLPLVKYDAPKKILHNYGDGGVAIIDQWICAHAKYYIGTCESTFSFRIHEERDILGFHGDQTFNCLCGDKELGKCEQPSKWRIVY